MEPKQLTCGSCWTAAHGINSSSYSWQPFSHPHTQCFISQLELTVSSTGILERIKNFIISKSFIQLPSSDVFKKGNYYFFFIITISDSNLYIPMVWLMFLCRIFLFRSYVTQICSVKDKKNHIIPTIIC